MLRLSAAVSLTILSALGIICLLAYLRLGAELGSRGGMAWWLGVGSAALTIGGAAGYPLRRIRTIAALGFASGVVGILAFVPLLPVSGPVVIFLIIAALLPLLAALDRGTSPRPSETR